MNEKPPINLPPSDGIETSKTRLDFLWKVHSYTNDYIRFADAKGAFIAASTGALTGALIATKIFDNIGGTATTYLGIGSLLLLGFSFWCCVMIVRPRLNSPLSKGFIFWSNITAFADETDFVRSFQAQDESSLEEITARHVHVLAGICERKYFWVTLAVWAGLPGGLLAGIAILLIHIRTH